MSRSKCVFKKDPLVGVRVYRFFTEQFKDAKAVAEFTLQNRDPLQHWPSAVTLVNFITMGWFSKKPEERIVRPGEQIHQKSHQPLNLVPELAQTIETLNEPVTLRLPSDNQSIDDFVNERPANTFIIDGDKDGNESIICTDNGTGGKTCLKLGITSIELFKRMQGLEYFCSLPDDVSATYFECRKIT